MNNLKPMCSAGIYFLPRQPSLSLANIFIYIDVSDRGSDQSARKRRLAQHIKSLNSPNILYFQGDCFLHNYHHAVRGGLELIDDMLGSFFSKSTLDGFERYFSCLSSVCSTWRLLAEEMMSNWDKLNQHDSLDILRQGRRYPYAVITGRWGCVEQAEIFLLERGRLRVSKTMLATLSKHMRYLVRNWG